MTCFLGTVHQLVDRKTLNRPWDRLATETKGQNGPGLKIGEP